MILVLAGNYNEYRWFVERHGLSYEMGVRYVSDRNHLLGHRGGVLICYGSWYRLPLDELDEIDVRARIAGMFILGGTEPR